MQPAIHEHRHIMAAIERSRESGDTESTPPLQLTIEAVLDYLDRNWPGQHYGEWGSPIRKIGDPDTIEATVWHAWWSDEDGGHIWEVNILLEED